MYIKDKEFDGETLTFNSTYQITDFKGFTIDKDEKLTYLNDFEIENKRENKGEKKDYLELLESYKEAKNKLEFVNNINLLVRGKDNVEKWFPGSYFFDNF